MKKIFIVAPQFPPSAMPPSQRVRLLVSHFMDFGWRPVVFTVDHAYREEVADPWMTELAGNQFDLVMVNCLDKKKTGRFGIGDLGLRMLPFLYRSLHAEIKRQKPDFILYPVPSWYIMVIAPFVKRSSKVPYAIDFIDPWVRTLKNENIKSYISQLIARIMEKFAVKRSDAILAVSQGILDDLVKRYPGIRNIPMKAIPYGVEMGDYKSIPVQGKEGQNAVIFRYIGAISDSMMRVIRVLLQAFAQIRQTEDIQVEFIGTSYAAKDQALPKLTPHIEELQLEGVVKEMPDRIPYRKAIELTRGSDIMLLAGDMTPYYSASKLMGLIASQQPFFAFLQRDSFPAQFLRRFNYKYLVEYTPETGSAPEDKFAVVSETLRQLITDRASYIPISLDAAEFKKNTAWGMTKDFADTLQKNNP